MSGFQCGAEGAWLVLMISQAAAVRPACVSSVSMKDVDNIREARDQDKKEVLTLIGHCLAAHQVNHDIDIEILY